MTKSKRLEAIYCLQKREAKNPQKAIQEKKEETKSLTVKTAKKAKMMQDLKSRTLLAKTSTMAQKKMKILKGNRGQYPLQRDFNELGEDWNGPVPLKKLKMMALLKFKKCYMLMICHQTTKRA